MGTQPYPSTERLAKVILISQTLQNTPPDVALPAKRTRYSPTLFLIKEARIYNGEKTVSSISGSGKTG